MFPAGENRCQLKVLTCASDESARSYSLNSLGSVSTGFVTDVSSLFLHESLLVLLHNRKVTFFFHITIEELSNGAPRRLSDLPQTVLSLQPMQAEASHPMLYVYLGGQGRGLTGSFSNKKQRVVMKSLYNNSQRQGKS